jgi:uncharacterized protein
VPALGQGGRPMKFEWDARKGAANEEKHGVSFEEAATVFEDPLAITYVQPGTFDEVRFLTLGLSQRKRALIVSHTERTDKIRIISARRMTRNERVQYEHT